MKTRIRFLCCSKDVLIHRGPNTYGRRTIHCLLLSYEGINAWKVSSFAFRRLLCLAAFDWSRNRNFYGQVFTQKKSTCWYKRIKAREALFWFVCFFSLPESLVANERRARGTKKRQTKNATLRWCRLRCLELARVHSNWLTSSHKLLLKVKSIKRHVSSIFDLFVFARRCWY